MSTVIETPAEVGGLSRREFLSRAGVLGGLVLIAGMPGVIKAVNHEVVHRRSGRKLGYGALALAAAKLPVPPRGSLRLKDPTQFRYIGKGKTRLVDGPDIVTGKAQYGIDTRLDGMLYSVVARSPVLGGKVLRYDATEALKIPGVVKVVEIQVTVPSAKFHPMNGVAVVAVDTWTAIKARNTLKIQWEGGVHGSYDSKAYRAELEQAARKPGKVLREVGDVDAAMSRAERKIEAEYYLPHVAHTTMEPPAATARLVDGHCEVWASVQAPQVTREDVSKHLGLPFENVTVHVTLLGGGFGRKSKPDFAIEAALLSQQLGGKPVKVTWTREDDIHNDYFHTVSLNWRPRPAAITATICWSWSGRLVSSIRRLSMMAGTTRNRRSGIRLTWGACAV
jgi:isoquinoline 1-oxidoreductase beta subunit